MSKTVAGMNPSDLRGELDDTTIRDAIIDYLRSHAKMDNYPKVDDNGELVYEELKIFNGKGLDASVRPVSYKASGHDAGEVDTVNNVPSGLDALIGVIVREVTNGVTKAVVDHIKENLLITTPGGSEQTSTCISE